MKISFEDLALGTVTVAAVGCVAMMASLLCNTNKEKKEELFLRTMRNRLEGKNDLTSDQVRAEYEATLKETKYKPSKVEGKLHLEYFVNKYTKVVTE